MLMTRDQMMGIMSHPVIAQPKLDTTGASQEVNRGQLIGKDRKEIDTNAMIDEHGRFIMKPKHI